MRKSVHELEIIEFIIFIIICITFNLLLDFEKIFINPKLVKKNNFSIIYIMIFFKGLN